MRLSEYSRKYSTPAPKPAPDVECEQKEEHFDQKGEHVEIIEFYEEDCEILVYEDDPRLARKPSGGGKRKYSEIN